MTYRERRARRAERLTDWSSTNATRAARTFTAAHDAIAGIPPGQPILVGHHSEKHHRRDLARHDSRMRKGFELQDRARDQASRADTIERQLDASIYDDDPDAVEQLTAKLAGLEAQRARLKTVNAAIRKHGYAKVKEEAVQPFDQYRTALLTPRLTEAEIRELEQLDRICHFHKPLERGFPPYSASNLTNLIGKTRERIKRLSGTPAAAAVEGETATARAGLIITAGQTTPTRKGKTPRPVWTVSGNLGPHRGMLTDLGGSWYRSAFSFWDDPTTEIEAACLARETSA